MGVAVQKKCNEIYVLIAFFEKKKKKKKDSTLSRKNLQMLQF